MTDGLEAARERVLALTVAIAPGRETAIDALIEEARAAERTAMVKKAIALGMHEPADCPGESALRAAAREALVALNSATHHDVPEIDEAESILHAALDGAPWEPSEEQVGSE